MREINIEEVSSLLEYDHESGQLSWKKRPRELFVSDRSFRTWNTRYAGTVAGTYCKGAVSIMIHRVAYSAHRVAWAIAYKEQPPVVIDHLDGDASNNRLSNLRATTQQINTKNRRKQTNNKSGITGIHFCTSRNKWVAQGHYTVDGKSRVKPLGRFDDLEAAISAREAWIQSQGDYTDRHGK